MPAKNDTVYGDDAMKLYFTSNHDENSWQGSAIERMGDDARAFFAMAFMMDQSFPLLYTGQEVGIDYRFPFFSKDTVGCGLVCKCGSCSVLRVPFRTKAQPSRFVERRLRRRNDVDDRYCDQYRDDL
jgi:hypothetical protein